MNDLRPRPFAPEREMKVLGEGWNCQEEQDDDRAVQSLLWTFHFKRFVSVPLCLRGSV